MTKQFVINRRDKTKEKQITFNNDANTSSVNIKTLKTIITFKTSANQIEKKKILSKIKNNNKVSSTDYGKCKTVKKKRKREIFKKNDKTSSMKIATKQDYYGCL